MLTKDEATKRKFIKAGALAAPAVMTLTGGRALAQTSSSMTSCKAEMTSMGQVVQNDRGEPLYYRITAGPDGKMNVKGPSRQKSAGFRTITPSCFVSLMP